MRIFKILFRISTIVKALMEYFGLKNQILWTGSQSSGAITIPNGVLYKSFIFNINTAPVYVYRLTDSTLYGIGGNNTTSGHVTREIMCTGGTISGVDLVFTNFMSNALFHSAGGSHDPMSTIACTQIIGVDPVIPESMQALIDTWGGVSKL